MAERQVASEPKPLIRHTSVSTPRIVREPTSPTNSTHPRIEESIHDELQTPRTPSYPLSIDEEIEDSPVRSMPQTALSTTFSTDDTLASTDSAYTSNTGGRARHSSRGGISNFWRPPTFLSNDPARPAPSQTQNSPIELPTGDEPRSFFDSDSEEDESPIIRQASSASLGRPRVVQHHSFDSAHLRRLVSDGSRPTSLARPGPSQSKIEQVLGTQFKNLHDLTPAVEKDAQLGHHNDQPSPRTTALNVLNSNGIDEASTTALAPTPPSPQISVATSSILEVPSFQTEALDTLPSPLGGLWGLRLPDLHSTRRAPLDGLRMHPAESSLQRAISAPPIPNRRRKVTIRPSDIDTSQAVHRYIRENIVSTPYPRRSASVAGGGNNNNKNMTIGDTSTPSNLPTVEEKPTPPATSTEPPAALQTPIEPPETLLLQLSLARHPSHTLTTSITISHSERSTFDDESLFTHLRHSYRTALLGLPLTYLTARRLHNVHLDSGHTHTYLSHSFDAARFLAHLHTPSLGRKRRFWLDWLRRLQKNASTTTAKSRQGSTVTIPDHHYVPSEAADPYAASWEDVEDAPFMFSGAGVGKMGRKECPTLTFTFTFGLVRIAVAVAVLLLLTVLVTILWVLFGVPGAGAAVGENGWDRFDDDWRRDAGGRVLTGCALGMLTLALGGVGVGGWIVGSWMVL